MITCLSQLDLTATYSYSDYMSWNFEDRVELIHGQIHPLGPSPGLSYHYCRQNLMMLLYNPIQKNAWHLFMAPFDVKLSPSDDFTVVQPDLCIVADGQKLTEQGCTGAPILIVEILTESTASTKMETKLLLYEEYKVEEYWLISPAKSSVTIYKLNEEGRYLNGSSYIKGEKCQSKVLPGFTPMVEDIF